MTKLIDAAGAMSDREREFVEKLYERYEQYQEQTYVSPKQLFWLRDLLEKYL